MQEYLDTVIISQRLRSLKLEAVHTVLRSIPKFVAPLTPVVKSVIEEEDGKVGYEGTTAMVLRGYPLGADHDLWLPCVTEVDDEIDFTFVCHLYKRPQIMLWLENYQLSYAYRTKWAQASRETIWRMVTPSPGRIPQSLPDFDCGIVFLGVELAVRGHCLLLNVHLTVHRLVA